MRKKFLSLLIAAVMVLAMVPATAFAGSMEFCPEPEAVEVEAVEAEEIEAEEIEVKENQNAGIMLLSSPGDVAEIGEAGYTTLAAAISDAKDGDTVKLLDSIALTSSITVSDKSITLDLNDCSITRGSGNETQQLITVESGAKLTITDSSSDGNGKIESSNFTKQGETSATAGIGIRINEGEVIVESGTVSGYYGIYVYGSSSSAEVTVKGGTVSGTYGVYVKGDNAELTVTGGTVSGTNQGIGLSTTGKVTIEGGTVTGGTYGIVQFGGTLNVTGGSISAENIGLILYGGTINITDGTIKSVRGIEAIGYYSDLAVNITGGTINASDLGIYISNNNYEATLTVGTKNGDNDLIVIEGDDYGGIYVTNGATATVNSGTVTGESGILVWGNSTDTTRLYVNGGIITGTAFGISTNGSPNVGKNYIEINGGEISGAYGMYLPAVNSETVITGGTITGSTTGIEIRAGELTVTGGTIESTSNTFDTATNGSGATVIGAGIAVSQHVTNQEVTVNISGGTISGYYGVYELNTYASSNTSDVSISIDGSDTEVIGTGTEGLAVYSESVSENTAAYSYTTIEISGGNYSNSVNTEYLSNVDTELYSSSNTDAPYSYYESTSAAKAAASDTDTITAVALLAEGIETYTVTLNAGKGTISGYNDVSEINEKVAQNGNYTLPTATHSGYTLVGWKSSEDSKTYKAGYSYPVTSNVEFTAQWEEKTYTHSYSLEESSGGSGSSSSDEDNTSSIDTISSIFTDLSTSHQYYDAIMEAYEKGYMIGISDDTFAADGYLTRAMAAQIIWNLAGKPAPEDVAPFIDVTSDTWYAESVAWCYENGIVIGYDYINYGPNDYLTMEQFCIMLAKYRGEVVPEYTGNSPYATRGWVAYMITA